MCGSKKYSYLPHGRDFFLSNPPPPKNSGQASYINLRFWAFESPHPPEISNPFSGGSVDIFWNYTVMYGVSRNIVTPLIH